VNKHASKSRDAYGFTGALFSICFAIEKIGGIEKFGTCRRVDEKKPHDMLSMFYRCGVGKYAVIVAKVRFL
jgi:hypothetical protein